MSMHMAQKQGVMVTAYKQPCSTGQTNSELQQDARVGMLAPISGCVVSVVGIQEAWYDMWFIPAGSQTHNKNDTCVYTTVLLTFADSHSKQSLSVPTDTSDRSKIWMKFFVLMVF